MQLSTGVLVKRVTVTGDESAPHVACILYVSPTAKEEKLACKIRATFSKPAFHSNVTHGGILFCLLFLPNG